MRESSTSPVVASQPSGSSPPTPASPPPSSYYASTAASGCSLYLGSSCWCGVPVRLHYTFFVLLAIELIVAFVIREATSGKLVLFVFILWGPILLLTTALHQFAGAFVSELRGGPCEGLLLFPMGGYALCGPVEGCGIMEDFYVGLAGPVCLCIQIAFWLFIMSMVGSLENFSFARPPEEKLPIMDKRAFTEHLAEQAAILCIYLLAFHTLIPAYPFDAARMWSALSVKVFDKTVRQTAWTIAITGMVLSAAVVSYSIYVMMHRNGMGVFLLMAGFLPLSTSYTLYLTTKENSLFQHQLFARPCYRRAEQDRKRAMEQQAMDVVGQSSSSSGSTTSDEEEVAGGGAEQDHASIIAEDGVAASSTALPVIAELDETGSVTSSRHAEDQQQSRSRSLSASLDDSSTQSSTSATLSSSGVSSSAATAPRRRKISDSDLADQQRLQVMDEEQEIS